MDDTLGMVSGSLHGLARVAAGCGGSDFVLVDLAVSEEVYRLTVEVEGKCWQFVGETVELALSRMIAYLADLAALREEETKSDRSPGLSVDSAPARRAPLRRPPRP